MERYKASESIIHGNDRHCFARNAVVNRCVRRGEQIEL